MIRALLRAGLLASVLFAGWPATASTEFLAYQGRDAIHEGQGGEKKVVDGVDFWMAGSPPQRFQVLGSITDERWRSGLYGLMQISRLQHDIAKEVRTVGGDGVIVTDSQDRVRGYGTSTFGSATYGNGWAFGSAQSYTHAYGTRATSYIVVKYLPEDLSPAEANPSQPSLGHSAATEVSLERQGGVMVVPVTINGTIQLKFLVDSGASDVSIPADVFLTLARAGTIDARDYIGTETYRLADGSTVPSARFRIRRLKVGDREVENVPASITDARGSLLLGQSFLKHFSSWSINNQRAVLILGETDTSMAVSLTHAPGQQPTPPRSAPIASMRTSEASSPSNSASERPRCGAIETANGVDLVPCKH